MFNTIALILTKPIDLPTAQVLHGIMNSFDSVAPMCILEDMQIKTGAMVNKN